MCGLRSIWILQRFSLGLGEKGLIDIASVHARERHFQSYHLPNIGGETCAHVFEDNVLCPSQGVFSKRNLYLANILCSTHILHYIFENACVPYPITEPGSVVKAVAVDVPRGPRSQFGQRSDEVLCFLFSIGRA